MPTTVEIAGVGTVDFPDSMSTEQIHAKVRQLSGGGGAPAASTSAGLESKLPKENFNRSFLESGLNLLPAAGGFLGGTAGGIGGTIAGMGVGGWPGAIGGSAVGGAGGEAARQLLRRAFGFDAPQTPQDALRGIGTEAAVQGAAEGGGRLVSGIVGAAARPLMRRAIRPTLGTAREFGDVVNTALRERVAVGRPNNIDKMFGLKDVSEVRKLAAANTNDLLSKANSSGVTLDATDVVPELRQLVKKIKQAPLSDADVKAVKKMASEFLRNKKGPLSPAEFNVLKQAAQAQSAPVFKAERMGQVVDANQGIKARFNRAVASGARRSLEEKTLPASGINELGASNARTQSLIGAERAIRRAELLPAPTVSIPYFPKVATELVAPGGAEALSRAALLASDPRLLFLLGQLPRAAGTLFPPPSFPDSTR